MKNFYRVVLVVVGFAHLAAGYAWFPAVNLFAANAADTLRIFGPSTLLAVVGVLLVSATLSGRVAGAVRFSIIALLIVEMCTIGPLLLFGVLLGGAMSGDSGHGPGPATFLFILGVPVIFFCAVIASAVGAYKLGKENAVSIGKELLVFLTVGVCMSVLFFATSFEMSKWTHLIATIDQQSLVLSATSPTLTGTVTGHGEICLEIVRSTYLVGEKMMLFGGDPNLIGGACTTSGDLVIENGHWQTHFRMEGFTAPLIVGTYTAVVTNWSTGEVLTKDTLTVN